MRINMNSLLLCLASASLLAACDLDNPPTGPDAGPVCLAPDPLPEDGFRFRVDSSGSRWVNGSDLGSREINVLRNFAPMPGSVLAYRVSDSGTETTTPGGGDTTKTTAPFVSIQADSARVFPFSGFADLIRYVAGGNTSPLLRLSGCLEKVTDTRTEAGPTEGASTEYAYKAEGDSLVMTSTYSMGPVASTTRRIVIGLKDGLRSWSWTGGGKYGQGSFRMTRAPQPARPAPVCFDAAGGSAKSFRVTAMASFLRRLTLDTAVRTYSALPDSAGIRRFAITETGTRTVRDSSLPDSQGVISKAGAEVNPVLGFRDFGSLAAALDPYAEAIPVDFHGCLPDSAGTVTQIPGTHSTSLHYAVTGDSLVFRMVFFDVRNQWQTTRVFERNMGLRRLESASSSAFGTNRTAWTRMY